MSQIAEFVIDSFHADGHGYNLESDERSDWRTDKWGDVELSHLNVIDTRDLDTEQPDVLSQAQLDSLADYLGVRLVGDVSADCDALLDALCDRKGPAVREATAALWATMRAGRLYDSAQDGVDVYALGHVDGVTEPEGYADDRARHLPSADASASDPLTEALALAERIGLSEGRKACKVAREATARRLWAYIEQHGRAFYYHACRAQWRKTKPHAAKLSAAIDGIKARYKASVAECRETGAWHRIYLTRYQYSALLSLAFGAFRAVKHRPGALPKGLI